MVWNYSIELGCGHELTRGDDAARLYVLGPGTEVNCPGCGAWTVVVVARRRNW